MEDEKKILDDKVDSVIEQQKERVTMESRLFDKYVNILKASEKSSIVRQEIRKFERDVKKEIISTLIPPDRMLLGFKDLSYTKPYAPRINPLINKDGMLTHNGMVILWIATRGAGKSIFAKKFFQDGIQNRYKVKVPTIIIDDNPTQEWDVGSEPITKLPQIVKQIQKVKDHMKKWNNKQPRGYSNIVYGFKFAISKNDRIDREITLTLKDIFKGMDYNTNYYIEMCADLIGLDEGATASRLELSRALKQGKELKLENISELKRNIRKVIEGAETKIKEKKSTYEDSEAVRGRILIPYLDNALDEGILSDNKTESLQYLFDDLDYYDNVILRMKPQGSGRSNIYQKRIGASCIFFLDKIIQERNIGCDSDKITRKKSRLSIEKYPCGPSILIEESKYVIPNSGSSYTGQYMEDQVNLGRKTGIVFGFITQFADMINDKIGHSAEYTFVSMVNNSGTRKYLEEKGLNKERIELELGTLQMKQKGFFNLELSWWKMITLNNTISDGFVLDIPYSLFKTAGT